MGLFPSPFFGEVYHKAHLTLIPGETLQQKHSKRIPHRDKEAVPHRDKEVVPHRDKEVVPHGNKDQAQIFQSKFIKIYFDVQTVKYKPLS